MFSHEIRNKSVVSLYDNKLKLLVTGTITGYHDRPACIIVNGSLYYPTPYVAQIVVHPQDEAVCVRQSTRRPS